MTGGATAAPETRGTDTAGQTTPSTDTAGPQAPGSQGAVGSKLQQTAETVKFEHSVFALPFALTAALLATGWPPPWLSLLWIVVAVVAARAFAMAVNRHLDRAIDARNPRTASRPTATGSFSTRDLLAVEAVSLALYAGAVVLIARKSPLVLPLSPIPPIAFIVYPLTKRFTWACHLWLGLCQALGPAGVWVALKNEIALLPAVLGLSVGLWVAGFDIIYALLDRESDIAEGVHSIPARFGVETALWVSRTLHLLAIAGLAWTGILSGLGPLWWAGLILAAGALGYEQWIVRGGDLSRVNAAFFAANGFVSIAVFAFALMAVIGR